MYISNVHLRNIRCFVNLELSFDLGGPRPPWTVILGDNATGKTALLRSIALGLCDESSAAGLMKESDEGYIRRGQNEPARITIELKHKKNRAKTYRINTRIEKVSTGKGHYERLRQTTHPPKDFPWDDLFACAYGAGRGVSGTGDIVGWSIINAVYNLFNYIEGLQNPELTIHRMAHERSQNVVLRTLGDILLGDPKAVRLPQPKDRRKQPTGISMSGPWGPDMPLRDLADGYRSCLLWITDMLGWAFAKAPQLSKLEELAGIVIVDELEQHMHATLQRDIVHRLRRAFPNMQFIATTHSPLIASAVGPLSEAQPGTGNEEEARDKLVCLELQANNVVTREYLPSMRLRRVDRVLASRAFKYLIDEDPSVERVLREASILAAKEERTPAEQRKYKQLRRALEPILLPGGQTLIERQIESTRYSEIVRELRRLSQEVRDTS